MLSKVIKAIEKYGMLDGANRVTVALSGGADSVCLAHMLSILKGKYGFSLSAIHINHQLRGEESDRDQAFAEELCKSLDIPLTVRSVDVNGYANKTAQSIELAARELRYKAFGELEGVVATAHHTGDNLETVIYNMTRGTGLKGLCGIPPVRDNFIRPLIFCTREEIENYLLENSLSFVVDSSNLTNDYTRNILRHKVTPVLKGINPALERRTYSMCENLREEEDFLSLTASKIYLLCLKGDALDAELLSVQHSAIIKRVIALYISERLGINLDSLHLNNLKDITLRSGRASLPQNCSAVCQKGKFFIEKNGEEDCRQEYSVETTDELIENTEKINSLFLKNAVDCDKIKGNLVIRTRAEGDSIRLEGRGCTKTLKKLFNEYKIPKYSREFLPVASDDEGVVWIYGIGVSERVAVDKTTRRSKRFTVSKIK